MKKLVIIMCLSAVSLTVFSQNVDMRRKIEVTGSAETEVTPDIIYFGISLKEYFKDSGNKKKVEIEEMERQLQAAVVNAGIPRENFMINNVSSYNYIWDKKKDPGFLARKQYTIKVTDLSKLNQIMSAVDSKGIESTNIERYDYSKMETLKRDLKVKALVAAKEKAAYLAEAIGEKAGSALEVQEISNESYPQPMYRANAVMMMKDSMASSLESAPIDFQKIKLSYQMHAIFELK